MSDEAKLAKHERVAKVMDFFMTCDLTDVNPDRLVAMGCQFLRTMPEQITEMELSVALSSAAAHYPAGDGSAGPLGGGVQLRAEARADGATTIFSKKETGE